MEMKGRLDGILRRKVDLIANDSEKKIRSQVFVFAAVGRLPVKGGSCLKKKGSEWVNSLPFLLF